VVNLNSRFINKSVFCDELEIHFVVEGYCPPEDIKIIDITTTGGYKIRPYRLII
jgi:hypothetical protein